MHVETFCSHKCLNDLTVSRNDKKFRRIHWTSIAYFIKCHHVEDMFAFVNGNVHPFLFSIYTIHFIFMISLNVFDVKSFLFNKNFYCLNYIAEF